MLDGMEPQEVMEWRAYFDLRDKSSEQAPKPKVHLSVDQAREAMKDFAASARFLPRKVEA
jgi:hypothetical protein